MKVTFKLLAGVFVLFTLVACSKSPLQQAVSASPDELAQAVNSNIDGFSYLVSPKDCVESTFDSSAYKQIISGNPFVKTKEDIDRQCNDMFSKLADRLNENTAFKGLIVTDLKNKAFWERYSQSQNAKYQLDLK